MGRASGERRGSAGKGGGSQAQPHGNAQGCLWLSEEVYNSTCVCVHVVVKE